MMATVESKTVQPTHHNDDLTLSVHCVYQKLDHDVHMYTFLRAERRAADHFLSHMADVFANTSIDELTRHVIVCHIGVPPLAHLFREARRMAKTYPGRSTRVAIVYKEAKLIDLASSFINTIITPKNQVKFFYMADYINAMAWVRQ